MNKTAIKNFSIWARNRLIADIKYRAGLMGITENGIANALPQSNSETEFYDIGTTKPYAINEKEIKQRRALVDMIHTKEKGSDYTTAYKYIIEEVAYTWFNRLIAIRFMEVNDYLPSHVRVLSSESGKMEPDIVTNPFDAELDLSGAEEEKIISLKRDNKLDEVFRMLFIKQCNALNEILPALFEKTSDSTEVLLNLSVIDKDGVVYHLVHDIPEDDFNVNEGGQVEIIGWMYQYYNTEPKNEAFAKKGKIAKEEIPAVTQLFTPDWIVRYMVENSLGRLWVEGHPDSDLQSKWKYYLEEAKQESEVQAELAEIREKYAQLKLEDIKFIDPCMGSGHILVYAFDVFMQMYENAGWLAREAAQNIVEHNIYGLDIDDRAAQLSYFAIMMKARQYDRRIFTRGIHPNVYAIQESNGIIRKHLKYFGVELNEKEKNTAISQIEELLNTLTDAKEYGSILNVNEYDWDLLRRFVNCADIGSQITFDTYGLDETADKLKELIEISAVMAQKYEVVATNPPYAGTSNLSAKVNNFVKKHYPDSKSDLFAVFIERCGEMLKENGYQAMITQHAWMFLSGYERLRLKLFNFDKVSLIHLGARAFDEISGEVVQTVSFVIRKSKLSQYKAMYLRLVDGCNQSQKEKLFFYDNVKYISTENNFAYIPGHRIAYWIDGKKIFSHKLIGDFCESGGRNKTHNNELYVRNWWEIGKSKYEWRHYDNGGNSRKWYGNCLDIVNWSADAKTFYASHGGLLKDEICEKRGVSWNGISSSNYRFKIKRENFAFSSSSPTIIVNANIIYSIIAVLNSKVAPYILNAINPTLQLNVGEILGFPIADLPEALLQHIDTTTKKCVEMVRVDWDSFEISWDFKRHPLLSVIPRNLSLFNDTDNIDISECYTCWENECNERFNQLKANEEELNRIFIDIYGLQDELAPEVEDKDVTVRKADLQREIKSLISYAVGCMFGRYSVYKNGLIYAGGEWKMSDFSYAAYQEQEPDKFPKYFYKSDWFMPVEDNIIPITDEEYLEDDIVSLFCIWLKTAFGAKSLERNLDFIAKVLGKKGSTSREVIRNYFLNDFFKDHCNTYSVTGSGKRPIYWLFDSGKQNGFKALVYMHRYNVDTIGNVRVDYLYRMQRVYESEISRMQDTITNSKNSREVSLATKRKEKLQKQLKECREYDEKIGHLALSRIELDLDDGVKVNYRKVQTATDGKFYEILADSKKIMVKEK